MFWNWKYICCWTPSSCFSCSFCFYPSPPLLLLHILIHTSIHIQLEHKVQLPFPSPLALCRLLYAGCLPAQLPECPACLTHCRLCAAAFFLFPSKGFFCLLRTLLLCYTTEEPEEGNPSTTICILYRRTLQGDKVGIIKSVGCFIMICMFLPCYTDHCVWRRRRWRWRPYLGF